MIVVGSAVVSCLLAAPAGAAPAGTWTVEGTTTARYRYEGRQGRIDYTFSTRLVVHDDGTIDGEVIEPDCDPSSDPITFQGRWSGRGHAGIASALRAFVARCYDAKSRLTGVRGGVRLSADATAFTGEFRARLRIPYVDGDEPEWIAVRLHGVVEGRRAE
jgi:hypothetical protein